MSVHPIEERIRARCPYEESGARAAIGAAMLKLGQPVDALPVSPEGWADWLSIAIELRLAACRDDGAVHLTHEGHLIWLDALANSLRQRTTWDHPLQGAAVRSPRRAGGIRAGPSRG